MSLVSVVARQSRAVFMITALLAAGGLLTGWSLPSDIYPPLVFPRIVVIAHAGMTPAESMIIGVTRPVEQALMEVPGIRRVRSRTFRGASEISAQFVSTTDMVVALQQVQNRVAEARPDMPADVDLIVDRLMPTAFPFFSMDLTGGVSSAELRDYGFYVLRPILSRVAGVGQVEVLSSDTREIEVIADPAKLVGAGLTIGDVAESLKNANVLVPAGRLPLGDLQHLVLASGLWTNTNDIANTPALVKAGTTMKVRDLASVVAGTPDRTQLIVGQGRDAATIAVSQQIGANILQVRTGIEEALTGAVKALPAGLHLTKTYDLAAFVEAAIGNARDAILIGGFLAVIVLLVFLRDIRLTLIAACTLPLTVLATFFLMWVFGESINLMSMGGLAVAIGLVIDDAVVVVENIHRRLRTEERDAAVADATTELIAPIVGSTLTTVVVFAPLSLLSGVVGQFFRALSLTLSAAVLVSLVLSLTLIPLLARAFARHRDVEHKPGLIERFYGATLPVSMRSPILGVAFAILLGVLGYAGYKMVGSGFLPASDEGGFVIDYVTPAGSSLEATDAQLRAIEKVLGETPDIATYSRRTGSELGLFATQQNTGDLLVRLKPRGERTRSADAIVEDLRDKLTKAAPDTEIEFVMLLQDMLGDLEGNPDPIEVKIFGADTSVLADLAGQLKPKIEKIEGIVDVVAPSAGAPEITWKIDPVASGRLGLTVQQVSDQLANAWSGTVATELRQADRSIPVRVRYPDSYRFDEAKLAATPVKGTEGVLVPASTLATITKSSGQEELLRENLRPMALITARLENRDLGSGVAEIETLLRNTKLPVGYTFEVGGQYAAQQQAFRELMIVFAVASTLVFIILLIQFERFTAATLIILAAPLSFGGALMLLVVTGTELNVSSAMGLILLVGLVVKNGIVLLDFAHRKVDAGEPLDQAVLEAARVRLRPILMTTLCTLFGLLPLAFGLGAGAEMQKPLALAVIGGLSLSTIVTLYLVPSVYVAVAGERQR